MSKNYALEAEVRERAGKGVARALRRENKVPAVIYGAGKEPINITMSAKEVNLEYNKGQMFTTLCDLKVGNDTHQVLARDIQTDVVKGFVQHVDFLRVSDRTRIAVNVPVNFINEEQCPGLQEGGVLNVIRYEVELVCRATSIPEEGIDVDLTPFTIGDSVKISDVSLPEGAKPVIDDRDFTLASIAAPRAIEVIEEEEAEGEEGEEGEAAEGEEGEAAEGEAEAEEAKEE